MNEPSHHLPVLGIGLMSGTSTDGLDIAACTFDEQEDRIVYTIPAAETIEYTAAFRERLKSAPELSGRELRELDVEFATYSAHAIRRFCNRHQLSPGFIASHGHTVFHQPPKGYTLQVGCGATLAALTGITTVCDFRQGDIALGGQGAPLVPAGDELLFGEYDYCLNLGGFANVSAKVHGIRIAYDICALNVILNMLARREGKEYDREGNIARNGTVVPPLMDQLNRLEYYRKSPPKSLGTEWTNTYIIPLLDTKHATADLLATFTEHAARQIATALPGEDKKVLVTGGGTRNTFLIERIGAQAAAELILPSERIIDYKEALIFALLGYLRLNRRLNILDSVTGARHSSIAGAVYAGR